MMYMLVRFGNLTQEIDPITDKLDIPAVKIELNGKLFMRSKLFSNFQLLQSKYFQTSNMEIISILVE